MLYWLGLGLVGWCILAGMLAYLLARFFRSLRD
jgi:hypothetical protein